MRDPHDCPTFILTSRGTHRFIAPSMHSFTTKATYTRGEEGRGRERKGEEGRGRERKRIRAKDSSIFRKDKITRQGSSRINIVKRKKKKEKKRFDEGYQRKAGVKRKRIKRERTVEAKIDK